MRAQDPAPVGRSHGRALRVAIRRLAAADEAMVRLYINLQARGGQMRWAWAADDAAADVVLAGGSDDLPGQATPLAIRVIDPAGAHPPAAGLVLRRPVLYDDLAACMAAAADRLSAVAVDGGADFEDTAGPDLDGATTGFATTQSGVEPTPEPDAGRMRPKPVLVAETLARLLELEQAQRLAVAQLRPAPRTSSDTPAGSRPDEAPPGPAPVPPAALEAATPAPAPAAAGPLLYRLTRWPPHDVLQRDPVFPRLAGFLGARPLSRAQLAEASGVDLSVCTVFIATLRSLSMLQVQPSAAPASAPAPVAAPGLRTVEAAPPVADLPAVAPAAPTPPEPALAKPPQRAPLGAFIHRLRRRFGLG